MTMRRIMLVLLAVAAVAALPVLAQAQSLADSGESSSAVPTNTPAPPDLTYTRPTGKMKLYNYVFDAFGPYPIVGAGFAAGVSQEFDTPPEWRQGAAGYGKRFGSDFGIAAVSTTTRYGLAQAFKQDTLYYRCECKGVFPRLRHAVISTLTARRGDDGHSVFSFPALVAPYAGSMTAVYAWYPGRYNGKDFDPISSSCRNNSRNSNGGVTAARTTCQKNIPISPNHSRKWLIGPLVETVAGAGSVNGLGRRVAASAGALSVRSIMALNPDLPLRAHC